MLWLLPLKMVSADVPSVDNPFLNVEEKTRIVYRYVLESPRDNGETLRLQDPVFHGMRWSKWGELSPYWELCTPLATGGAQASWGLVTAQVQRDEIVIEDAVDLSRSNCPIGPNSCTADIHSQAATVITAMVPLEAGDEITIVLGDSESCLEQCNAVNGDCSRCSDCGFETPDRAFTQVPLNAEWCVEDNCNDVPSTKINISAQPQVRSIWITAPSINRPSEAFPLKAALLDYRGNPVPQASIQLSLINTSLAMASPSHTFSPADGGWHDFPIQIEDEGVHRIELIDGQGNTYRSPPIWITDNAEQRIYWGDIHVHHGWTTWTDDGERIDHNHVYGRDVMGLDVVSESMKARGIELNPDALWSELQDNCRQYTVDGEYVALLGFEWIGDIAAAADCGDNSCSQGHHNIYYADCNGALGDLDANIIDGLEGPKGLWPWLKSGSSGYTSIPHAMQFTRFDFSARDASHQHVAEIYSEWGDNSINLETAGSTAQMLRSGLRLGWIGGSDNHDGWMGNPKSVKNTPSGLAAFWAGNLSIEGIFHSIQKRNTIATTGHRPILQFSVEDNNATIPMGEVYVPAHPEAVIRYHGTANLEMLRLYAISESENADRELLWEGANTELDVVQSIQIDTGKLPQGLTTAVWVEALQIDGEKAWSSPIWLAADCSESEAIDPLNICSEADSGEQSQNHLTPPSAKRPRPESRCQLIQAPTIPHLVAIAFFITMIRRKIDTF